jgi:hypothetical protein
VEFRFEKAGLIAAKLFGVALVAALAASLGGCADLDLDKGGQVWFQKPLDVAGRNAGGYTFSELAETKQRQKTITPNDLVNANGTCPTPAAPPPAPQASAQPGNAAPAPAPATNTDSLLGGGVALGMSECDIVFRAGAPSSVQIGARPNGDRTAVLTFDSGPRAGVYRFDRGTLIEMNRVAQTAPPPKAASKSKPQKKINPS